MTTWTIEIEAVLSSPVEDLADATDELLTVFEKVPFVLGPVTFLNLRNHTFGVRFALQNQDFLDAVQRAASLFYDAAHAAGLDQFMVHSAEIFSDNDVTIENRSKIAALV